MPPQEGDAQDSPSVVVADDEKPTTQGFFSFADPGQVPWWSLAIVGTLGCLTLASIIIIAVNSGKRQPPVAFAAIERAQCPYVSPLLPFIAYTGWLSTCKSTSFGQVAPCNSQVDCAWLGGACASSDVVAQLRCEVPTLGITSADARGQLRKVCSIAANTAFGASPTSGGFCTTPGTACAVCAASGTCDEGLSGCVPAHLCTADNASNEWICV